MKQKFLTMVIERVMTEFYALISRLAGEERNTILSSTGVVSFIRFMNKQYPNKLLPHCRNI
jgi:hypothetical protein